MPQYVLIICYVNKTSRWMDVCMTDIWTAKQRRFLCLPHHTTVQREIKRNTKIGLFLSIGGRNVLDHLFHEKGIWGCMLVYIQTIFLDMFIHICP